MSIHRIATTTALACAALGVCAGASFAATGGGLEIVPGSAAPGATVTVNTTACGTGGTGTGNASSVGAAEFKVAPTTHKEDAVGQFTIPHTAKPGAHTVSVKCADGKTATGTLTVTGNSPKGAVKAGSGGAADSTAATTAGIGALGAAAIGGAWMMRRRAGQES
ncbi:hypothetical protein [Streptomyces sp. NBC_00503]|uniref:hypothetical protein n=1 Tax=Streptomyces sp. NBC_00503 TaxID=2903659 RepID=UPI002E820431|nr:hypothetical protein [Streptomyces sp. NBC_00503]WUD84556.1 hypothetical protein OG490_30575 [Streptomyces sp. NBC_00503]